MSISGSTTPKSCDLDPVPGHVLKCLVPSILPVIHKIVNLSLETGRMPGILKQAILKPLLKKPSLNSNDFMITGLFLIFVSYPKLLKNVLLNS